MCVSRLLPYKNVGAVIAAFDELRDQRLVVVGDGPELERLRKAAGPNVRILSSVKTRSSDGCTPTPPGWSRLPTRTSGSLRSRRPPSASRQRRSVSAGFSTRSSKESQGSSSTRPSLRRLQPESAGYSRPRSPRRPSRSTRPRSPKLGSPAGSERSSPSWLANAGSVRAATAPGEHRDRAEEQHHVLPQTTTS